MANTKLHTPMSTPTFLVSALNAHKRSRNAAHFRCDGENDDATIQAAIDALPSSGGRIVLSEETFNITTDILLSGLSDIRIEGSGKATVLKLVASLANNVAIFSNVTTAVNRITFSDFLLDGNKSNQGAATGQDGITLSGNRVHFTRVDAINFTGNGLTLTSSIESSDHCTALQCYVDGCNIGISFKGGTKSSIDDCVAVNSAGVGINAGDSSRRIKIIGCEANGNGTHGIAAVANGEHSIIGNHCQGNTGKGIRINSNFNTIIGNVCEENEQDGITLSGADFNTVNGNVCVNNNNVDGTGSGIEVSGSDFNVIVGNQCRDTQGVKTQDYGVELAGTSVSNIIIGNDLRSNKTAAILQNGTGPDTLWNNQGSILDGVVADPGDGNAIPANVLTGHCPLVSGGAETRTLADATAPGQTLDLYFKTDGGDCVVTAASPINQAANTIMTFADVGDHIRLASIEDGSDFEWRIVANDGVALS